MKYLLFLSLCLFAFPVYGQRSHIYFIESDLLKMDFAVWRNYSYYDLITINGHVSLDDTPVKPIFAGVSLSLEVDGVMYSTECDEDTDKRGVFTLKYPEYVYKNKKIRKFLKIERIGYKTELINIDKYRKADTMEIVLKKQIATFPSVKVEGNNYYVDFSDLYTNAGKLPIPFLLELFYNQLCAILSQDDSWRNINKIEFFFEFDERGTLININSDFQNKTFIEFFKQQKWSSARVSDGSDISLNASLTIYNTMK